MNRLLACWAQCLAVTMAVGLHATAAAAVVVMSWLGPNAASCLLIAAAWAVPLLLLGSS